MTRPLVTSDQIDAVYDAVVTMRIVGQVLSEGEAREQQLNDLSWLLASARRRLEPISGLLELFEYDQTHGDAEPSTTKASGRGAVRQERNL
ncbi:hypothetical protein [Rhizobium sp. Leaf383]|uniref:hypothetical protein n=1 Tax=Rhizobium sp. Leaf383 TaxID=1736357 RepID=UPI000713AC37|nr:hypothetical protein [Rhizobium sp. Leaf383]KQS83446.1 hypothetical protein ASG58_22190 [Rhizobium sp. Leaf383]